MSAQGRRFDQRQAQALAEAVVIRPAGVFDTDRGVIFIRSLPIADGCHVNGDQLGDLLWKPTGRAVADFFIIGDQDMGGLKGFQPGVVQGFQRGRDGPGCQR